MVLSHYLAPPIVLPVLMPACNGLQGDLLVNVGRCIEVQFVLGDAAGEDTYARDRAWEILSGPRAMTFESFDQSLRALFRSRPRDFTMSLVDRYACIDTHENKIKIVTRESGLCQCLMSRQLAVHSLIAFVFFCQTLQGWALKNLKPESKSVKLS